MLKNRTFWIVVAVVVVVGVFAVVRVRQARAKAQVHFDTTQVDRGKIVAKVTATGTLSAIVTVQVGSQVSGRIAALYADYNSTVKKGELVAKIDPQLFEAAVAQARANLVAAQGNLAKAKAQAVDAERQYKRNVTLAERKLIAQADLDTSQATADADKAAVDAAAGAVEQARAGLHSAEVNLAYTDIISPTDGIVIARNVDVGQTVVSSLQASTLFLIAEDLRKMQVDTSVAEADIGKLKAGMKATFTVDAYQNERFTGTVRQVRNSPQTVQNVVTYDAVIDVSNPELKLKPGMTANCTFVWAERDEALRVANAALRFHPPADLLAHLNGGAGANGQRRRNGVAAAAEGGAASPRGGSGAAADPDRRTVWVLRDGTPRAVVIRTGVSDGSLTEIVEGDVSEGDRVVTEASTGSGAVGQQAGRFPGRMF
ncbi:MAG TPA: efflux RND transporter periplasmic adaptor subunit [Thermoanaerobaculaceae bacterium]|nr:efflux RND transporter periplasmic adaptor subunit [Thermoanaerobaculaceae bacterium]